MEFTARLIKKETPITGQGKNGEWKRQNIILETDGMYPKKICVAVWGDKININDFQENSMLTVHFDLESREFNNNWYTDIKAWKIDQGEGNGANLAANNTSKDTPTVDLKQSEEGEDLPF